MAVVGEQLWTFDKSDGNHTLKGGYVRRLSDLSWIGSFQHNISHAATADYAPKADTMMLGNGGDGSTSTGPRIDLFPGFKRYSIPFFLNWFDQVSSPRISISLVRYGADGSILRSVFRDSARRTANAVWIDDFRTILVFGKGPEGLVVATMQLGRGTEDFSAEGYGTFLFGRSDTQFNGTAKVLATYTTPLTATTQDADWHDGKLYLSVTAAAVKDRTVEVMVFTLVSGGTLRLVNDYRWIKLRPDGSRYRFETEGVTFRGDEMLVSAVRDDNYHSVYRFDAIDSVTDLQQ